MNDRNMKSWAKKFIKAVAKDMGNPDLDVELLYASFNYNPDGCHTVVHLRVNDDIGVEGSIEGDIKFSEGDIGVRVHVTIDADSIDFMVRYVDKDDAIHRRIDQVANQTRIMLHSHCEEFKFKHIKKCVVM